METSHCSVNKVVRNSIDETVNLKENEGQDINIDMDHSFNIENENMGAQKSKEKHPVDEKSMFQDIIQYETQNFRIDHFAECLADDVLEDSLIEVRSEIENIEKQPCITSDVAFQKYHQNRNNKIPTICTFVDVLNDSYIETDLNNTTLNENELETSLIEEKTKNNLQLLDISTSSSRNQDKNQSNAEQSPRKKSESRVYSKSLCLVDSNYHPEEDSTIISSRHSQSSLPCQHMEEKLRELSDLQQFIQKFPNEDIIPYDQEDECCSNSVVEGLDKLLSDDDIDEDMENVGNIVSNTNGCEELLNQSNEECSSVVEKSPLQEYNLFSTIESPADNQIMIPGVTHPNTLMMEYSTFPSYISHSNDQISAQNSNDSNETPCDKPTNVITNPEAMDPHNMNQTYQTFGDMANLHVQNPAQICANEIQGLSNMSSLFQYFPEQGKQVAGGCIDAFEVIFES